MLHKRKEQVIVRAECFFSGFKLSIEFMLAARDSKDDWHLCTDGLGKRQIGCRIAGMEAYHHSGTGRQRMIADIPFRKVQICIAAPFRQRGTAFNNLGL